MSDLTRASRSLLATASLGALAGMLLGCGTTDRSEVGLSLVELAPSAELTLEAGEIDFGTRAARNYLVDGWSWNQIGGGDATLVWSLGSNSTVGFDVLEPRTVQLRLRCRPRKVETPPTMQVSLNGRPLTSLELGAGWSEYNLTLPGEVLRPGRNLLEFDHDLGQSPSRAEGQRNVSVAWDWIRFAGFGGSAPEHDDGNTLTLTAGTRLDYFVELDEGSRLVFERVELQPGSDARLFIHALSDASEELEIAEIRETSEDLLVPLAGSGLTRLRLNVVGGGDAGRPAKVRLVRPAVLGATTHETSSSPGRPSAINPTSARPSILIYLIDTLRADRLGVYGNQARLTPTIDAFAEQAIVFERAVAQSPWTLPSVASLFTGVWPLRHGTRDSDSRLPDELPTLPELLSSASYRTGALVTNAWISSERGFDRGVERFDPVRGWGCDGDSRHITRGAAAWLEEIGGSEQPFFLYVHSREPHAPYAPPDRLLQRFAPGVTNFDFVQPDHLQAIKLGKVDADPARLATQLALYDGEVACADQAFEQVLDLFRQASVLDDMLVVLLGDHGEEFREHGSLTHGHSLHRELLGVPLIVRLPRGQFGGTRVSWGGQHIDVLPTLLDYLQLPRPPHLEGQSLLEALGSDDSRPERPLPSFSATRGKLASVVYDGWKAIAQQRQLRTRATALYDLTADPWEESDVSAERPVLTGYLLSLIRREIVESKDAFAASRIELDPETAAELEALGYL